MKLNKHENKTVWVLKSQTTISNNIIFINSQQVSIALNDNYNYFPCNDKDGIATG